jgi:hypothetical protein
VKLLKVLAAAIWLISIAADKVMDWLAGMSRINSNRFNYYITYLLSILRDLIPWVLGNTVGPEGG